MRPSDSRNQLAICTPAFDIHLSSTANAKADNKPQATNSPTIIPLPTWLTIPNLPLNAGTIGAIGYSIFYLLLEPVAGTVTLPMIIGWTAFAKHLTTLYPTTSNLAALGVFTVAWIAQFVGHGVFEKRAPALLTNLVQALVLAPFFVFMEALFKCGYRPELQSRVNIAVEKELAKFNAQKPQNGDAKNGKAL